MTCLSPFSIFFHKVVNLCFKFILGVSPNEVNEKFRSGGSLLQRPVTTATHDFDTNASVWPLNKPIPKIEGLLQCSGTY